MKPEAGKRAYKALAGLSDARRAEVRARLVPESVRVIREIAAGVALPAHDAVPTLVVAGTKDLVVPLPLSLLLQASVPGAQLASYPTGHFPMLEPDGGRVVDDIVRWVMFVSQS